MDKAESASKVATNDGERSVGDLVCILGAWTPGKGIEASEQEEYVIKLRTLSQDVQVFSPKALPDTTRKLKFDFKSTQMSLTLAKLDGMLKITLIKMVAGKSADESEKVASTQIALSRICDMDAQPEDEPKYYSLDLANENGRYGSFGIKFKFIVNN